MRRTETPIFEFEHLHFVVDKHFTFVSESHRFRLIIETMHSLDEKQFNFINDPLRRTMMRNKLFPEIRPRTQMSQRYRDDCFRNFD